MNPICLTVLFNTPRAEWERFLHEWRHLGIPVDYVDNSRTTKGYAEGINELVGKYHAEYDTFLIANPDISVHGCDRMEMLSASQWFDIWGFTMRQEGSSYYGGEIDSWRLSGGLVTDQPEERYASVEFVSGSLMVIKKMVIDRVGPFSTEYGMYYEDVDYCVRARKAGFRIGIDRDVEYVHYEVSQHDTAKKQRLRESRWKFFHKFATPAQKARELLRYPKTVWEERQEP